MKFRVKHMSKLLEIFCRRDFLFEPKASVLTSFDFEVNRVPEINESRVIDSKCGYKTVP